MPDSRKIALFIETSSALGRGLLLSIGRYAHLHDCWSLHLEERALGDSLPDWLQPEEYGGVILRARERAVPEKARERGLATVCLGEDIPPGVNAVINDDALSAELAADHLLERNFRHFAFVGIEGRAWSDVQREAFAQKVREAGHDLDVLQPVKNSRHASRWDRVSHILSDWISDLPKPVGIMCCDDVTARAVIEVCREIHVPVPEEVAVVGVGDDEVLCEISQPRLTSVALDTRKIGFEAASMLDRLIGGEPVSERVVVPPLEVIARCSTDSQAIADPHVASALTFIRRRACDGIEAGDVVDQVPVSRRTLERRFRAEVGRSLLEEIHQVRMERMTQFLRETDLTLDAISSRCGFSHTPHMAAQFRKLFGMTPGQYRKNSHAAWRDPPESPKGRGV